MTATPVRVALVDDDALTLELHRSYVERLDGFAVVAECGGARAALTALADPAIAADLVLLDMSMPDGTGLDVLRHLRAAGSTIDVIAVTSMRDAATVRATASLGVVQYLVKPFTFATFRERMTEYRALHERAAHAVGSATQEEIDRLLSTGRSPAPAPLPKGLSGDTLDLVGTALRARPLTASEAAASTGLSRVVARRYL
ncbi:response regulator [Microbacterium sp. SORGH_AS_0888]|uniref:response regulator n=1 Tax=Microbacterium sp. SORGH_AS_0888 TaxID=3041791 RepID=UPI002787FCE4|nr:response regulator [Microbacterium sp. SORGH_AS_0888]MDQ1129110.1 response regulator of citrate/malate metabolism [Microbacterium sp. SORGH_AS_0888]